MIQVVICREHTSLVSNYYASPFVFMDIFVHLTCIGLILVA